MRTRLALSTLCLIACANVDAPTAGNVSDLSSLAPFNGQQTVVPEYVPGQDIVISYLLPLFAPDGGAELVARILDAGANTVIMLAPANDANADLVESMAALRAKLGDRMSRIKLIRQPVEKTRKDVDSTTGSADTSLLGLVGQPDVIPTVWARDWSPISARTSDGELRLLDFKYYPNRPLDDQVPNLFETALLRKRIPLPFYAEGGNFMSNENGDCFITDHAVIENARPRQTGDKVVPQAEIEKFYNDFAGCKRTITFPRLPNESTGHIDIWAKMVAKNTVLLNEVTKETVDAVQGELDRLITQQGQDFLKEREQDFVKLGYTIIKIPMPIPIHNFDIVEISRSYTNSLLVNSTAIIPRYSMEFGTGHYPDEALLKTYEEKVAAAYTTAGFKPVFVTMDQLITMRGSIHCATMEIR